MLSSPRARSVSPAFVRVAVCAALAASVVAVYAPVRHHAFIAFDDNLYVYENPHVREGLTPASVAWAFRSTEQVFYWHPVTWLSHLADVELFGLDAGRHHLTSVLLHAVNAVLLFLVLLRLTGATGRSAIVAAAFALHPQHVESVAWIAERKDLLSVLFGLLAVGAYARYAARPSVGRYLAVAGCFVLALLSKPMLVTLPLVLLLLDYWPLGRIRPDGTPGSSGARAALPLVLEKVPLLVLSAASSAITVVGSSSRGAVTSLEAVPFPARAANAVVSYARYLGSTFWPARLSIYYPYPAGGWSTWQIAGSAVLLVAITAGVIVLGRAHRYLPVGWFWFLGTLVPVIGFVQAGMQALADRFSYLPHIGLFIAVVWGGHELLARLRLPARAAAALAAGVLAALALATRQDLRYWRDTETLFGRALAVTTDNWVAHGILGAAELELGDTARAMAHFEVALRIRPGSETLFNLGTALAKAGRVPEAVPLFRASVAANPRYEAAWYDLGHALLLLGEPEAALEPLATATGLDPGDRLARHDRASALLRLRRLEEAAASYRELVQTDPGDVPALTGLGIALARQGRFGEAVAAFREAARLNPLDEGLRENLSAAVAAAAGDPAPAASRAGP